MTVHGSGGRVSRVSNKLRACRKRVQQIGTESRCSWFGRVATVERLTIQRMDHVGIVVDDLAAATAFFVELDSGCRSRAVWRTTWLGPRASGRRSRWWRPRTAMGGSS
jgi:hypothetical protein